MNKNIVTGIDIGGSHITAALIDLQAHAIIKGSLIRRPVNSKGDAAGVIKEWTDTIADCKAFHPETSNKIGIAMPGPFDYEKGICLIKDLDKYESLYNLNVKELLSTRLEIEESNIFMMNDASCFLKGELFGGAARDCNNVIGLTLGTGLGSAIWKDGVVYDGDLYYTPFKDAAAEDYISARWLIKRNKELTGVTAGNVKEIRERVKDDETVRALFKEFGNNLGGVLADFIRRHDAETVVIGGNIVNAWELFIHETERVLKTHSINVSLHKAMLGEEAALMGAGSICYDPFKN